MQQYMSQYMFESCVTRIFYCCLLIICTFVQRLPYVSLPLSTKSGYSMLDTAKTQIFADDMFLLASSDRDVWHAVELFAV